MEKLERQKQISCGDCGIIFIRNSNSQKFCKDCGKNHRGRHRRISEKVRRCLDCNGYILVKHSLHIYCRDCSLKRSRIQQNEHMKQKNRKIKEFWENKPEQERIKLMDDYALKLLNSKNFKGKYDKTPKRIYTGIE